ncbi:hypothetical protein MJM43_31635, partial [Salmonella enterica subsp. enterica serovar Montevideo]|nr:hypothetical protein [Salmonella enterica subsp. enterica serovar Montevideo]
FSWKSNMSYTPMSDLGQQGLFDITRTLLQQPDLASLSEALSHDGKIFVFDVARVIRIRTGEEDDAAI